MKDESTVPTIPVRVQTAAYAAVGRGPAVASDFGDAAPPYRTAPDVAAGPALNAQEAAPPAPQVAYVRRPQGRSSV